MASIPQTPSAASCSRRRASAARSVQAVAWTSDVFADGNLHFVTLHHVVDADGEPEVREPDKVEAWGWYAWDALPEPLFAPAASLLANGWRPA